ncbi:uncharacterized protein ATC70_005151 [Mucor velutinosus]|uniref:Uncharacterized protein n=1 Tax=Mucor velutinosus TaxID=708070 RepID=A0AAN7D5V0_9FUNG|nr:hypothetical protein ATC70_005151 [Mucor velutinosus]
MKTFTAGFLAMWAIISTLSVQVLAVTSCSCDGVAAPLLNDMCVCGCELIKKAFATYSQECPAQQLADLDAQFALYCKGVENTEDCEYFKKLDGKVTDLYKRCKDDLDSIHDDCEECKGCSF